MPKNEANAPSVSKNEHGTPSNESPPGDARPRWEKPVLLPLSISKTSGVDVNFIDEDDFGLPS